MRTGDNVILKMKQPLLIGMALDEKAYEGKLQRFDETEECCFILLREAMLTDISLDAVYQCEINTQIERISCIGRVRERYHDANGKTIKFEIKNGFSKINVK